MKSVVVYHSGYGCDTGCCGHRICYTDGSGKEHEEFTFSHFYGAEPDDPDYKEKVVVWIKKEFKIECVGGTDDLEWENCTIYDGGGC